MTTPLYVPKDLESCHERWGLNCGPAALAACLGVDGEAVRPYFPGFEERRYVNPTQMKQAISLARRRYGRRWDMKFPHHGVVLIQILGPWCESGVRAQAAYRHTHWIAASKDGGVVFDVNADLFTGWLTVKQWSEVIVPNLLAHHKRATGWAVKVSLEVES